MKKISVIDTLSKYPNLRQTLAVIKQRQLNGTIADNKEIIDYQFPMRYQHGRDITPKPFIKKDVLGSITSMNPIIANTPINLDNDLSISRTDFNLPYSIREKIYKSAKPGIYPEGQILPAMGKLITGNYRMEDLEEIKNLDTKLNIKYNSKDNLNKIIPSHLKEEYDRYKDITDGYDIYDEDLWRFYLGLPLIDKNSISRSKYKPTRSDNEDAIYYSVNFPKETESTFKWRVYLQSRNDKDTKYPITFRGPTGLANITLDRGEDEKGKYYSIYDKYDFDIPGEKLIGKPFELYDRIYEDEFNKWQKSDTQSSKNIPQSNIKKYQHGGQIDDPPTSYPTSQDSKSNVLFVDDKGHSRYKAYQDSLNFYNYGQRNLEAIKGGTYSPDVPPDPNPIFTNSGRFDPGTYPEGSYEGHPKPIGFYVSDRSEGQNWGHVAAYKKPTQRVIVGREGDLDLYNNDILPRVLAKGTQEYDYAQQQMILQDAGLYQGRIDGIWGKKSQAAQDEYDMLNEYKNKLHIEQVEQDTIYSKFKPKSLWPTAVKQARKEGKDERYIQVGSLEDGTVITFGELDSIPSNIQKKFGLDYFDKQEYQKGGEIDIPPIAQDNTYTLPVINKLEQDEILKQKAIKDYYIQQEQQVLNTGEIRQQGTNAPIRPKKDDWYYQGMLGQPQPTWETMGNAAMIGSLPFDIATLPMAITGLSKLGLRAGKKLLGKSVSKPSYINKTLDMAIQFPQNIKPISTGNKLQLKSTMRGSDLAKQVNKKGQIATGNIRNYLNNPNVSTIDRNIIDKVLYQQFRDKKFIPYKDFKQAISDELIPLNRQLIDEHASTGLNRIGYEAVDYLDDIKWREIELNSINEALVVTKRDKIIAEKILEQTIKKVKRFKGDGFAQGQITTHKQRVLKHSEDLIKYENRIKRLTSDIKNMNIKGITENKTTIFSNPKQFGRGSSSHFRDFDPLAHNRYLVTNKEPNVFHVLEGQSDYFQSSVMKQGRPTRSTIDLLESHAIEQRRLKQLGRQLPDGSYELEGEIISKEVFESMGESQQVITNKIKAEARNWNQKTALSKRYEDRLLQENILQAVENGQTKMRYPTKQTAAKIEGFEPMNKLGDPLYYKYHSHYETILKHYSDMPKRIKKILKVDVKIITDNKRNTWYEFDIPQIFKDKNAEIKALSTLPVALGGAYAGTQ